MRRALRKLVVLSPLFVAVGARAVALLPAVGPVVEVRIDGHQHLLLSEDRQVDGLLRELGRDELGVDVEVPPGHALVRRGDGWAIESASLPQLDGVPLDVNRASAEALASLDGVGARTARAIVAARPYRSVDELVRARGVGPATLDALRPNLRIHPRVPPPPKVAINCAEAEALESLPRIGPALAAQILSARPFGALADLEDVPGIGPTTVAGLGPFAHAGPCR